MMYRSPKWLVTITAAALALSTTLAADATQIIHVDDDAPPGGDGMTWPTAFNDLQHALAAAQPGVETEIRVAQGTYKPAGPGGDREATFQLLNNLALRGGYAGLTAPDPDARDVDLYETTLSGDLDTTHTYHVLTTESALEQAELDGFTITGGLADGPAPDHFGGGLYVVDGTVEIRSCTFRDNTATRGVGLYAQGSTLTIIDSAFLSNVAVPFPEVSTAGGGAFLESGTTLVQGTSFFENSGAFGGALLVLEGECIVRVCVFEGNAAAWGGGIDTDFTSSTVVEDSQFRNNAAAADGGGIRQFAGHVRVLRTVFENNTAGDEGGGLDTTGNVRGATLLISESRFEANTADFGGGVSNAPALEGSSVFSRCVFINNEATLGGGVRNFGSTQSRFVACAFLGNHATDRGGGLWNSQGANPVVADCILSGNTAGNHGGAVINFYGAHPLLINCAIANNHASGSGGGIYNEYNANPIIYNTIIWNNTDGGGGDESAQLHFVDGAPTIHYSAVQGWTGQWGGTANSADNPSLIDPDGADDIVGTDDDDLRLAAGSPAIDAGINAALPRDLTDLDGDGDTEESAPLDLDNLPRLMDIADIPDTGAGVPRVVDLGAYEHHQDCNGNGIPDVMDIQNGQSSDCNANDIPDECEPSPDCNGNGQCDDHDILDGTSSDCDGSGVPDECEQDCNENGLHDDCDIADGTSEDCDGDGRPDECLDATVDCNHNGLIDACETASGATPDVNNNGLPDECEPPVLFVNGDAAGLNDGTSWTNAFVDLQEAFQVASQSNTLVDEIWVAQGTYTPTGAGGLRTSTFMMPDGIGMYGGFAGDETVRSQRDALANETVLSGDLDQNDVRDFMDISRVDNAFHVVTSVLTGAETVIDGFTIADGHATPLTSVDRQRGAGLWIAGAPTITQCVMTRNFSVGEGAGMYCQGKPRLTQCTFLANRSDVDGGALYVDGIVTFDQLPEISAPLLSGCDFVANTGRCGGAMTNAFGAAPILTGCRFFENISWRGGAVFNDNNNYPTFVDCLFVGNYAEHSVGAFFDFNSASCVTNCTFAQNTTLSETLPGGMLTGTGTTPETTITNCIFWGNANALGSEDEAAQLLLGPTGVTNVSYTCIQGLKTIQGVGNLGDDPSFVDPENDNFRLHTDSPAIDAGDPDVTFEPGDVDLDGHARVLCTRVDMGPYEFGIGDFECDRDVDLFDLANWAACQTGPDNPPFPDGCEPFDFNADLDVDLEDFSAFQRAFSRE